MKKTNWFIYKATNNEGGSFIWYCYDTGPGKNFMMHDKLVNKLPPGRVYFPCSRRYSYDTRMNVHDIIKFEILESGSGFISNRCEIEYMVERLIKEVPDARHLFTKLERTELHNKYYEIECIPRIRIKKKNSLKAKEFDPLEVIIKNDTNTLHNKVAKHIFESHTWYPNGFNNTWPGQSKEYIKALIQD